MHFPRVVYCNCVVIWLTIFLFSFEKDSSGNVIHLRLKHLSDREEKAVHLPTNQWSTLSNDTRVLLKMPCYLHSHFSTKKKRIKYPIVQAQPED